MDLVNITEYNGVGPLPNAPAVTTQNVASVSTAFHHSTKLIRIVALVDCRIVIGFLPTFDKGATVLPAGTIEYFSVIPSREYQLIVEAIKL